MPADDFKAAFRAKVKAAKPSKEQLRALKAKKAAEAEQASTKAAAPPQFRAPAPRPPQPKPAPAPAPKPAEPAPAGATALPSNFFDYGGGEEEEAPPAPSSSAPAPAAPTAPARGGGGGALPEGFYADKDADQRARGVTVVKRSLEEEMADFQASVAQDLRSAEEAEQAEAEELAREKEEREEYEHDVRRQKVLELRSLVRTGPQPKAIGGDAGGGRSKRQKTLDMLMGVVSSDEEGSGDEEGGDLLDWRAKGV
eukprot:jgi/Tetstr1/436290/TSEL_025132.t1